MPAGDTVDEKVKLAHVARVFLSQQPDLTPRGTRSCERRKQPFFLAHSVLHLGPWAHFNAHARSRELPAVWVLAVRTDQEAIRAGEVNSCCVCSPLMSLVVGHPSCRVLYAGRDFYRHPSWSCLSLAEKREAPWLLSTLAIGQVRVFLKRRQLAAARNLPNSCVSAL